MAFNPPVIDNFTGSNGSINGRTSSTGPVWTAPEFTGETAASITSNAITVTAAGVDNSAVLAGVTYGPDVQIALTITLLNTAHVYLTAFSPNYASFPAVGDSGDFYYLEVNPPSGDGSSGDYILHRSIGASSTEIIPSFTSSSVMNAPESIGLWLVEEPTGTRCKIMRKIAGVWAEETNVLDTNGSRPIGPRHIGFDVNVVGGTVTIDDYMGQTEPSSGAIPPVGWLSAISG